VGDRRAEMKAKRRERSDIICPTCGHHTVSRLTKHGWVCKECGTITKKEEWK